MESYPTVGTLYTPLTVAVERQTSLFQAMYSSSSSSSSRRAFSAVYDEISRGSFLLPLLNKQW